MRREAQIPLFLWVATAVVVHGLGGGGATTVAQRLEETLDIQSFAKQVRRQASYAGPPVEVTLLDSEEKLEELLQADDKIDVDVEKEDPPEDVAEELAKDAPRPEAEPEEKKKEQEEAAKKAAQEKPTPPSPFQQTPKPKVPLDNRRVAVDQKVEDENQEDNESAEFAGEHANRVKEQTRARITSSDGSGNEAQMGGPNQGAGPEVGNSEKDKLAQSDESEGRKDEAPGETSPERAEENRTASNPAQAQPPASEQNRAVASVPTTPPPQKGQTEQKAQAAEEAKTASPETITVDGGSYAVAKAQKEQAELQARAQRKALPGSKSSASRGLLGLGSGATTPNGINLNLNFSSAHAVLGADHLAQIRKKNGERRLTEHRGKWQSLGLERWRPALENYVANVKPGNQTALNTARVPFARYLNQIHQRLHEVFADRYLGHLDQLPADHPLNNKDMSTHLEIALSREDGRVVRMGITKSSGVTLFDVGALDSVQRAAPYGPPPNSILSSDGNVYLHWEFHRRPEYACSTYFARPFIIDLGQEQAPPRVDPKAPPQLEEKKPATPEKKSGAIDRETRDHDHQG